MKQINCPKCEGTTGYLLVERFQELHTYDWDGQPNSDGPFVLGSSSFLWQGKMAECRDCGAKMRTGSMEGEKES